MKTNKTITNNTDRKRFELQAEGKTAFIDYILNKGKSQIHLVHTEVPAELEGKGIGTTLVEGVLRYAEEQGWEVSPICPFVVAYIRKHPEWKRVLPSSYTR